MAHDDGRLPRISNLLPIRREHAIAQLQAFQQRLRSRRGLGTDSVGLLREMREETPSRNP